MKPVRTRFAPSPTGALHAGTIRTALFAWLVAKQNSGQFLLRIEDTDRARSVNQGVQNIIDSLNFVGIDWDEGPNKPADDGPFIQSQRLDIYANYAKKLIKSGRAYADPYTLPEIDELRNKAKLAHKPFLYRDSRPINPPKWDGTQAVRLKSIPKEYQWDDLVMGKMSSRPEAIDDFIIIKSDGYPTYNFAHIIDDMLMRITHVIRSQEFIASMPRFLNLYEALEIEKPLFATLPPILNSSGNRKLSKREGAKQILEYKTMGIMPEALINFLAMLGWNDGTTQQIFSIPQLINKFDLSRVQKSGAQFNEEHLVYLNGLYIRKLTLAELFGRSDGFWSDAAKNFSVSYKKNVLGLIQERLKYFSEIPDLTKLFFEELPVDLSLILTDKNLNQLPKNKLIELLTVSKNSLEGSDFSLDNLTQKLNELLLKTNEKPSVLFSLIRIATTQAPSSPGLAGTLNVLGKQKSIIRLSKMLRELQS